MRTFDFTPHYRSTVSSAPPASRAAVRSDPKLTTAEKRAVLASWISDVRAVEDAPSLRWLDSGAVVEVDAILQALVSLDEQGTGRRGRQAAGSFYVGSQSPVGGATAPLGAGVTLTMEVTIVR
jgi:hypothetical protein